MIKENLDRIKKQLPKGVQLVVVSKFRSIHQLNEVYEAGERNFAENRVQELVTKYQELPKDIQWHLIGHLQTNKVKYIAPFVALIHSVDSVELALEINKQALKNNRVIPVLVQFHVAKEESKFGVDPRNGDAVMSEMMALKNIEIKGIMGMATHTDDKNLIREEFQQLHSIYNNYKNTFFNNISGFDTLSMGMSSDYLIAIEEGSNLVRIGSLVFEE